MLCKVLHTDHKGTSGLSLAQNGRRVRQGLAEILRGWWEEDVKSASKDRLIRVVMVEDTNARRELYATEAGRVGEEVVVVQERNVGGVEQDREGVGVQPEQRSVVAYCRRPQGTDDLSHEASEASGGQVEDVAEDGTKKRDWLDDTAWVNGWICLVGEGVPAPSGTSKKPLVCGL